MKIRRVQTDFDAELTSRRFGPFNDYSPLTMVPKSKRIKPITTSQKA